jgi:hypothetical protein
MRLFKEIVRQVWKQWVSVSETALQAAKAKLAELDERKNRLVDFLLNGRSINKLMTNRRCAVEQRFSRRSGNCMRQTWSN